MLGRSLFFAELSVATEANLKISLILKEIRARGMP
jgi:hypothetical protein